MISRKQVKRYVGKWVVLRTNQGVVRGQLVSFDGKHLKLRVPRKPKFQSMHTSLGLEMEQADMFHSAGSDFAQPTTVGDPYCGYPYPRPCFPCFPCVIPFVAITGIALLAAGAFFF